jgi:hypothetical protein
LPLVLGTAAPGLGQDGDRDERSDARDGQFIVQGEEVWVAPFGGQQRAGVVDDGGHYPAARWGLVVDQPGLDQELAGALAGCWGERAGSVSEQTNIMYFIGALLAVGGISSGRRTGSAVLDRRTRKGCDLYRMFLPAGLPARAG